MSGVAPLGIGGVLAMRAKILERSEALRLAAAPAMPAIPAASAPAGSPPAGFGAVMEQALKAVNAVQGESSAAAAAYERGETHDIASVMLARQKASLSFEATLQARNRLLSAYRDVMSMPV